MDNGYRLGRNLDIGAFDGTNAWLNRHCVRHKGWDSRVGARDIWVRADLVLDDVRHILEVWDEGLSVGLRWPGHDERHSAGRAEQRKPPCAERSA
jgi:hypothetical protein